jgi:nucleotide-binding universal stress UspA family protein
MAPSLPVSSVGVLPALAFGGAVLAVMLWILRALRVSADAAIPHRSQGRVRMILVPVAGDTGSQRRVELACRLAEEQWAMLLLVYVIEVPWTLPLDATLEQADREARAALGAAREIVERHHLPVQTVVRRARLAREGIAATARDHQADIVFSDPTSAEGRWHFWSHCRAER